MTLLPLIKTYIEVKQSLGAVFSTDARILRSFGRSVGDIPLDAITSDSCRLFCLGQNNSTRFCERKQTTLRGFFRYLVSRNYLQKSPLPELEHRVEVAFQPYIYSKDQLQRLLDSTTILGHYDSDFKPQTYRTLLLLLYGAGLRAGEALRLRCCDVELAERVLAIWDSKFFKSRLVPIGEYLNRKLKTYSRGRIHLPMFAGYRSAFFVTEAGKAISLGMLESVFVQLREHAGIKRPSTDRWQPRLHDLRHTFAVHRLIAWYREGVDVQTRLPLLSTYLGHVNVSGTQVYLTMTPELLTEASLRFESYASVEKEEQHG